MGLGTRIKNAWNAFMNKDPTTTFYRTGPASSYRPDRVRLSRGADRSIINSIYNRFASDCAAITIEEVIVDMNDRYLEAADTGLTNCLTLEANIDQTGREFVQDAVMSMLDEGTVAVVPIDTDDEPSESGAFDILTMRVGKITMWYPDAITVNVYDDRSGRHRDITVPKRTCAILTNPFFSTMNEPNSTFQRLVRTLNLIDQLNEKNSQGKLDLIVKLPYAVHNDLRRAQAEQRRKDIEDQLTGSKYGIAYVDSTENITQLNRPVENQLQARADSLTSMLYSQLGISEDLLKGKADEKEMLNYTNRIIEPILSTITNEFKRKFLTKTARTQGHSIKYFKDPFKLVPVSSIADIADKMTRNEIMTSNEIRQILGMKPSSDPNADVLRNKNISQASDQPMYDENGNPVEDDTAYADYGGENQNEY